MPENKGYSEIAIRYNKDADTIDIVEVISVDENGKHHQVPKLYENTEQALQRPVSRRTA